MTGNRKSASSKTCGTKPKPISSASCLLAFLAFMILSGEARAQLIEVPATWGGTF